MNRACNTKHANLHEHNQHASSIRPLKNNLVRINKLIRIIPVTLLAATLLWSCSENLSTLDSANLKATIDKSAFELNTAMDAITATSAYSILTISDGTSKSEADALYKVYIPLELVKGVYNYKPVQSLDRWGIPLIKFFKKTADNSKMIVNMPLKKVTSPRSLRQYNPADSTLANNFSIAVSEYHNNYNNYHDFDYVLKSEISVDAVVAGKLNIDYLVSPAQGITYASQYAFSNSYTADYAYQSGDTAVSSFAVSKDGDVLYKEERLTFRSDTGRFGREHQYSLTIGDVKIVRKSGVKTVEVYVNDILQSAALVEIIDRDADAEPSVCKKREVQITFEDGTVTTVSALIGSSVENIRTLFDSLHNVYFAAYIVDWIAYDIYYQRN